MGATGSDDIGEGETKMGGTGVGGIGVGGTGVGARGVGDRGDGVGPCIPGMHGLYLAQTLIHLNQSPD